MTRMSMALASGLRQTSTDMQKQAGWRDTAKGYLEDGLHSMDPGKALKRGAPLGAATGVGAEYLKMHGLHSLDDAGQREVHAKAMSALDKEKATPGHIHTMEDKQAITHSQKLMDMERAGWKNPDGSFKPLHHVAFHDTKNALKVHGPGALEAAVKGGLTGFGGDMAAQGVAGAVTSSKLRQYAVPAGIAAVGAGYLAGRNT